MAKDLSLKEELKILVSIFGTHNEEGSPCTDQACLCKED